MVKSRYSLHTYVDKNFLAMMIYNLALSYCVRIPGALVKFDRLITVHANPSPSMFKRSSSPAA